MLELGSPVGSTVFCLRFKDLRIDPARLTDLGIVDAVADGNDILVPLVASGVGRVQTSNYVGSKLLTQVSGRFVMWTELHRAYPQLDPAVSPRLIVSERGRSILSGSRLSPSASGITALMALHHNGKWRTAQHTEDEPGEVVGMFLHLDVDRTHRLPPEVAQSGFHVDDPEQVETPLKLPLCWAISPPKAPPGTRPSERVGAQSKHFLPPSPSEFIRKALAWAQTEGQTVATGVTSFVRRSSSRNAVKTGRMSDLSIVSPTELRMLIEGTGFMTMGGLPIHLALIA